MRNYMFDRDLPVETVPAVRLPESPAKKRRGILVAALLLTLIAVLAALAVLFQRIEGNLLDRYQAAVGGDADYDDGDTGFGILPGYSNPGFEIGETTIPRAPSGVGALMSVTENRDGVLTGPEIYQKVRPSIVSVQAFNGTTASSGSGVILSEDGYVITNYHVIAGMREAAVTLLTDGHTYRAALVGYYSDLDIAVLKINADGLTPAEFGSSRMLLEGETVYALGNPMGYLYGSFTSGIVSALNRIVTIEGHNMTLIQTDAPLNSGNSGGALVNAWGQVVGITSAKIDPPSDVTTEALGLAIPISDVRRCVNTLLRKGEMENPAIGIMCQDWPDGAGILVVEVNQGGPASDAGLQPDDVILTANGIATPGVEELKDIIYDLGVGAQLDCDVLRDGEKMALSFILDEA